MWYVRPAKPQASQRQDGRCAYAIYNTISYTDPYFVYYVTDNSLERRLDKDKHFRFEPRHVISNNVTF